MRCGGTPATFHALQILHPCVPLMTGGPTDGRAGGSSRCAPELARARALATDLLHFHERQVSKCCFN